MAIVTFPIELGGNGLVVSDDTDPVTGLRNGGYLTRFVPALQQTVAVAGFVVGLASGAADSEAAAAGFATSASTSATNAAGSAASAATLYDQFDDRYLGPKASNPAVDNDGNARLVGAMYFNTSALETRVWNGTTWQSAATVGGVVNSLTVTGALEYQGTLTGGTGVINIGGGQFYKNASGLIGLGTENPTQQLHQLATLTPVHLLESSDTTLNVDEVIGEIQWKQNDASAGGVGIVGRIRAISENRPDTGTFFGNSARLGFFVAGNISGDASQNAPVESLSLRSNGNVGVRVVNPELPFVVVGESIIGGTEANGGFRINPLASGVIAVGARNTSGAAALAFRYSTSGGVFTEGGRISETGQIGFGVVPENWGGGFRALQVGSRASFGTSGAGSVFIGMNYYQNSGGLPAYITGAPSANISLLSSTGDIQFLQAPTGTAGAETTFFESARFRNSDGSFIVGATSFIEVGRMQSNVNTAAAFTTASNLSSGDNGLFKALNLWNENSAANAEVNMVLMAGSTGAAQHSIGVRKVATNLGDLLFRRRTGGSTSAETLRVTSSGYFKATNTGTYTDAAGNDASGGIFHHFESNGNSVVIQARSTNTGSSVLGFLSALVTGATGNHFHGRVNNVTTIQIAANGNLTNTNNSYGAISDPKLKDIIGPKSSTWEKTKQYNWVEYYLKSDSDHSFKMLGLNAEEAAAISPGVVDESPDLVEVSKVRQVPVQIVRLDENENPVVDEDTGEVIYDEVMVDEEYTEWEPNGEFTKSVKYSVVSMQYHRTTQECQQRIEDLETAKVQTDDLIQQIMGRVAALESASA